MSLAQHALFLACVLLACYVQNLTGFAFGLVLLGLAGLMDVAPLPTLTHVVSVLVLVNAVGLFRGARPQFDASIMLPTLSLSLAGVLLGVGLLSIISADSLPGLKLILGMTILGTAIHLVQQVAPLPERSSRASFAGIGLLSGVLGGLFSTAGPPLVYHFYRQPMPQNAIRDALVTVFAVNALLRLALMGGTGQLSWDVLWLSAEAVPIVLLLTRVMANRPAPWPPETVKRLVCLLLVGVALGLMKPALSGLLLLA
jgi:hypothetical protein